MMRDQRTAWRRREWMQMGVASALLAACGESKGADDAGMLDASLAAGGPPKPDAGTDRDAGAPVRDAAVDAALEANLVDIDRGWLDDVARRADLTDFHAGFLPSSFVQAATAANVEPDDRHAWPAWSLDQHLRFMDQAGISVSCLSLAAVVDFGDRAASERLIGDINDEAVQLVARAPERLRFYASLPLQDIGAAVVEWRRVRQQNGCIGATLLTNAAGTYLGAASFDPLWKELNDERAIVLLQAATPSSWSTVSGGEPFATLELYFEIVRACMSMFEGQVLTRYPDLRVIVPYSGGALPIVLDRMQTFGLAGYALDPSTLSAELQGLWFDCAGTPFPTQLPALLQQVAQGRVLYGSDSGWAAVESVYAQVVSLEQTVSPTDASWRETLVKNGSAFFSP